MIKERGMVTIVHGIAGKVCAKREEWKPLRAFSPSSHGATQGFRTCWCRPCVNKERRAGARPCVCAAAHAAIARERSATRLMAANINTVGPDRHLPVLTNAGGCGKR